MTNKPSLSPTVSCEIILSSCNINFEHGNKNKNFGGQAHPTPQSGSGIVFTEITVGH